MLTTVFTVLRQAAQRLRLAPGYTCTVLLVLALGIGATTAIFSVVYGVLLKPYGFERRGELIVWHEYVREYAAFGSVLPVNYLHFLHLRQNAPALESAAIAQPSSYLVGIPGEHLSFVRGLEVSADFFRTLGVSPSIGRNFLPGEFIGKADANAVLTAAAWQHFFPGQSFAPGCTLHINGELATVVGVLPASFHFPAITLGGGSKPSDKIAYGLFTPHIPSQDDLQGNEEDYNYFAIGRLRPGVSVEAAQAQMDGIERAKAAADHLVTHPSVLVEPFSKEIAGGVSQSLVLLLCAVGAVLLIGCINLANLQLARSVGLMPEQALRSALGASRKRLVTETLTENLLLAFAGMLLALPVAELGLRLFLRLAPANLPRQGEVALNLPVFTVALAISLLTSFVVGLLPAWRAGSIEPLHAMQAGNRNAGEPRSARRLRSGLLITEMACSVVLLVITGLLSQSFSQLASQARTLGDEPVTMAQVDLDGPRYQQPGGNDPSAPLRAAFVENAIEKLQAIPGVTTVDITSVLPLTGETSVDGIVRPDHPLPMGELPLANRRYVSPGYFGTLHIPMLAGRAFTETDKAAGPYAVISESAAKAGWPEENPLGHKLNENSIVYTVVGIAADSRINDPRRNTSAVYLPFWYAPPYRPVFLIRGRSVSASEIKQALWSVDPQVAIPTVLPLAAQTAESVAVERFQALLVGAFGAAGLLLAMLGVYGAVGYSVNRRMREWGLRMALGSGCGQLQRTVLREAARPLAAALVLGVFGSFAAERWVRSLLYGGAGHGWAALLPALFALPGAVLLAAWPAARRAAHADPASVLRME